MAKRASVLQTSIQNYYRDLADFAGQSVTHETAVRSAFQALLADVARTQGWLLIPELGTNGARRVIPDGTLRDSNNLPRGYWEAKDTKDNLSSEITKKIARGYPLSNIIFEDTRQAVLYQNGREVLRVTLSEEAELKDLLAQFFAHTEPNFERFDAAIEEFKLRVPDLASGLAGKIAQAHKDNKRFIKAYEDFFAICTSSIDPNISRSTVDEMLVQHLLTERLIRTIFEKAEFTQQNIIAREVERVIDALASKSFSRREYLKSLDRFYLAIEGAAATLPHFSDKQHFLNTVYERFFQGYSVKQADTHGVVYTPQPIVDFMCQSVTDVIQEEFGQTLASHGINFLDPCTGTGNFVVNLLNRIPKKDLARVYDNQLFANEIMLLPYYIATLNIEHAYYERTAEYKAFEGLCFVDTLDLAEDRQIGFSFMTEENTERVKRQRSTPITVIIGNPPYNAGQQNENENNKNRDYEVIDGRIRDTYARASDATLKNKLYDPYVRFFRWAVDRLGERPGIICFVTNNSFVWKRAFGGMQKHMLKDFSRLYHVDLHGDVRANQKLSGTAHNVFGIQTGVGITLAVKHKSAPVDGNCLYYHRVPEFWRREQKLSWLAQTRTIHKVDWLKVPTGSWLALKNAATYEDLIPLGQKHSADDEFTAIFDEFSLGVSTNRDEVVYAFDHHSLAERVEGCIDHYNAEVDRYRRKATKKTIVDNFIDYTHVKWSDTLKAKLKRLREAHFDLDSIRPAFWRPFTTKFLYLDDMLVDRPGAARFFPTLDSENVVICCTNHAQVPFMVQITDRTPDAAVGGRGGHCFPKYRYDSLGKRLDNITEDSVSLFRSHYAKPKLSRDDIFFYVYGVLHSPSYRQEFAENLRNNLPRIPLADDFTKFRDAGRELSKLHLNYDSAKLYPLSSIETPGVPLSFRVEERMRLTEKGSRLIVNESLTLDGIPAEAHRYKLGNRSALEWLISQYYVSESGDPNRPDDEEYIIRLVAQVVHLSVETVGITDRL